MLLFATLFEFCIAIPKRKRIIFAVIISFKRFQLEIRFKMKQKEGIF